MLPPSILLPASFAHRHLLLILFPFHCVDPFQETKRPPPLTIDLEDEGNRSEISLSYRVLGLLRRSFMPSRRSREIVIRFELSCGDDNEVIVPNTSWSPLTQVEIRVLH